MNFQNTRPFFTFSLRYSILYHIIEQIANDFETNFIFFSFFFSFLLPNALFCIIIILNYELYMNFYERR